MYSEARCDPLASEISEFHQHTSSISKRANVAPPILAKPLPNLLCSRFLLQSRETANVYFGKTKETAWLNLHGMDAIVLRRRHKLKEL
jgi:hypothetical protein